MDEKEKAKVIVAPVKKDAEVKPKADNEADVAIKALAERDEQITKLRDERDNYKNVALKRLGKLPGDSDFVEKPDEKTGLTVEEIRRLAKQNSELLIALKNRPSSSIGGGSGDSIEVKDNVLSEQQILNIRARAVRLKVKDVEAFVETAKRNILSHR